MHPPTFVFPLQTAKCLFQFEERFISLKGKEAPVDGGFRPNLKHSFVNSPFWCECKTGQFCGGLIRTATQESETVGRDGTTKMTTKICQGWRVNPFELKTKWRLSLSQILPNGSSPIIRIRPQPVPPRELHARWRVHCYEHGWFHSHASPSFSFIFVLSQINVHFNYVHTLPIKCF